MNLARQRTRRQLGQATTETMIMMSFLLLMIFGLVHMSMLAATKYMVNYAAFAAARANMVEDGWSSTKANLTAWYVMDVTRWWSNPLFNIPIVRRETEGQLARPAAVVYYRVPFGLPIFNRIPFEGIQIVGYAPVTNAPGSVPERGDNAE